MNFNLRHMHPFIGIIMLLLAALFSISSSASADVGVGVGLGKVAIEEPLKPGGIYRLPTLPVLNTGDETGDYEVAITYLSDQEEMRPEQAWFRFTPQQFTLEPGKTQSVEVSLTLPVKMSPGDYFAFLEARPASNSEGNTIGIAAASKLSFTVEPGTVLGAAIARATSFAQSLHRGWYITLAVITGLVIIRSLNRNFSFSVSRRSRPEPVQAELDDEYEE